MTSCRRRTRPTRRLPASAPPGCRWRPALPSPELRPPAPQPLPPGRAAAAERPGAACTSRNHDSPTTDDQVRQPHITEPDTEYRSETLDKPACLDVGDTPLSYSCENLTHCCYSVRSHAGIEADRISGGGMAPGHKCSGAGQADLRLCNLHLSWQAPQGAICNEQPALCTVSFCRGRPQHRRRSRG